MTEKIKLGDVVRHENSGKIGIVTGIENDTITIAVMSVYFDTYNKFIKVDDNSIAAAMVRGDVHYIKKNCI